MKKILFAALFVTAVSAASAQVNKGHWLVGGNAGFQTEKYGDVDESKSTHFNFHPNVGYFFINNLAGGLRLSFSTYKQDGDDDAFSTTALSPFVRYYFLPSTQKVNVFADASYGFGSVKEDDEKDSFNQYTISAGPAIFITPNTALEFALQYSSKGGDYYGEEKLKNFGVNVGFQIHLGSAKK